MHYALLIMNYFVSLHQITIRTNDDEKKIALCHLCALGRDGS